MLNDHGQVVVGFDALEDFCKALLAFRDEQQRVEAEPKAKVKG
jgi:hypothetical protein